MKVQDRTPEYLGPYRLIRQLGAGGMGVVYLAADSGDRLVAVKALHPGMAQEENARRRLAREVETMRRVHSTYVAEVVGADLSADPPYIVTRYVPGLTLDAVVGAGGPLAGPALARLARGLAEALAAVHAAGVVHRDLKPGNVMISDGEPVVIDFGIAQVPETTRLTMTGMFMGTPGYLAPEVIEGKDSGTASDVHSWAATVAFAATGRPPFGAGPYETIFFRIVHGQPDLDTLPEPLWSMVTRALSRDPAARPSAGELARWAVSLDATLLVPSPPAQGPRDARGGWQPGGASGGTEGAPAVPLGALPQTTADQPAWTAWPDPTRPLPVSGPEDVRDLLPPVSYPPRWPDGPALGGTQGIPAGAGPAGARQAGIAGSAGTDWTGAAAGARAAPGPPVSAWAGPGADWPEGRAGPGWQAGPGAEARTAPVSPWSPLVLSFVAALVALSVYAPLAGTAIALGVIVALRAAGLTGRRLARRRQEGASSPGSVALAVALYPVTVVRSAIVMIGFAPVALLGFAVAAAVTIIVVPAHPLPQALALGAGTLVAVVGLGPGSATGRAALAGFLGSVGGTPGRRLVVYLGVLAIAGWACLTAWSQPAVYWPVRDLHVQILHLPAFRTVLSDIRQSLLSLARRFGL